MVGFKCGVALFLASTQLPKLFGIHGAHGITATGIHVQAVEARSSVRERLRGEGVNDKLGGIDRFTRGLLVGFTYKKMNFTTYVFNLDQGKPTWVFSVGVSF